MCDDFLYRVVDVSPLMSPVQLAEQAVDLNLRLMRWRAVPDLDIAALPTIKCLLLGETDVTAANGAHWLWIGMSQL